MSQSHVRQPVALSITTTTNTCGLQKTGEYCYKQIKGDWKDICDRAGHLGTRYALLLSESHLVTGIDYLHSAMPSQINCKQTENFIATQY